MHSQRMSRQTQQVQHRAERLERAAFGLSELAASLGVSEGFLRLEIARGRLAPMRIGRRVLIPTEEWGRYLRAATGAPAR